MYLLPLSSAAEPPGMLVLRGARPGQGRFRDLAVAQVRARDAVFRDSVRLLRWMTREPAGRWKFGGDEVDRMPVERGIESATSDEARVRLARARAIPPGPRPSPGRAGVTRSQHVVGLIMERVDREFAQPLALSRLADEFQMNPSYLSWVFAREAGMPFKSYLATHRVQHAQELLRDPLKRISEVASQVGYATPHRFRAAFRSCTGISPSGWRTALRDDPSV